MAKKSKIMKNNNRAYEARTETHTKEVKGDKIEVEGKVKEVLKGGDYLVELINGHTVEAYVSGKMRVNMIRILPGDSVTIELSPYDLTRGRITWNKR